MTENKRYVVMVDTDLEISLKDNITKKYPFSLVCENIDEFEPLLNEVTNVCEELNKKWEQTLRFEDYNQELAQRNIKYENTIDELKNENKELKHELQQCKKIKKKRMRRIRHQRAVLEEMGAVNIGYKGQLKQLNYKIKQIKELLETKTALSRSELERILND